MATIPKSLFIEKVFEEFNYFCTKFPNNAKGYLNDIRNKYGEENYNRIVDDIKIPNYLTMHIGIKKIILMDKVVPYFVLDAQAEGSPFEIHKKTDWKFPKLIDIMINEDIETLPPMIKFCGNETSLLNYQNIDVLETFYEKFFDISFKLKPLKWKWIL